MNEKGLSHDMVWRDKNVKKDQAMIWSGEI